jgi:gamma-glutamyltranspeptidase/glutathione hydrolase
MRDLFRFLALCCVGTLACQPEAATLTSERPSFRAVATSTAGMVVTGSPYATEAGVRMLEAGGNAVDAAVAAAFALAVAEPTQSGLGGRTQILIRMADGTLHAIDGTTQVPAGYDPATAPPGEHGYGAIAIPGTVAALTRALQEHGTSSLGVVMEPAVAWARGGIALPVGEVRRIAEVAPEIDPASEVARVFLGRDGVAPESGSILVQPDLARVLETVAAGGADVFYRGAIARAIAEDIAANGGFVAASDLAEYRALDSPVGRGRFRDLDVVGSYLPAAGVTVAEILDVLDHLPPMDNEDARWVATLSEALLAGFEDRETAEHMPEDQAVAWLTSDSLADRRAHEVTDRVHTRLEGGGADLMASPRAGDDGSQHPFTTHVSVADTFGNTVALTQSLGPTMGARVVTPGLGFLYASTLGGYLSGGGPGYRPWSSQAPLIVLRDGRPLLVIGGAGARRILSALVVTLVRWRDGGVDLEEAMAGARLHPTGDEVQVEEGWPGADALFGLGYRVVPRERSWFARLNAVEIHPDETFLGVGEPRWPESAAGGPRH